MAGKARKGKRMTRKGKWDLNPRSGLKRTFSGTLLGTFNLGPKRIAVFTVPKGFK